MATKVDGNELVSTSSSENTISKDKKVKVAALYPIGRVLKTLNNNAVFIIIH